MNYCLIENVNSYYEKSGSSSQSVILLHGWGQNTEMMAPVAQHLSAFFTVYNIDFPGFGKSEEPPVAWSPDDYCEWLKKLSDSLKIENPILIGHSFGGHIAMRYASRYPVYKMVLTGAAGLKPKRGADYYLKVYGYKASKKLLQLPGMQKHKEKLSKQFGSEDYQNTTGVMRETFVKVVNSYVNDLLSSIHCSTLLVYGSEDDATPLWMGEYLEKHLPDAGLAVFENQGHYAYFVQIQRFNAVLDAFFKEDK
ncbi:MAG: alpha/beta hydrolase [Erysipelotrichaceae bacterium]